MRKVLHYECIDSISSIKVDNIIVKECVESLFAIRRRKPFFLTTILNLISKYLGTQKIQHTYFIYHHFILQLLQF